MRQIRIEIGDHVSFFDLPDDELERDPIIIKVKLVDVPQQRVISRAWRFIEVHGDTIVVI